MTTLRSISAFSAYDNARPLTGHSADFLLRGPPEDDDLALVQAFLEGSERAFQELVSRHQVRLYAFIRRQVHNAADTADICQLVFLQVFLKAKGFRAEAEFRTWLYRIAVNLCKNHYRARARRPLAAVELDTLTAGGEAHESVAAAFYPGQLRRAVTALPFKQRTTLHLRIYQDCTYAEIAAAMRCPIGTAKANYHRAVASLRRKLGGMAS